MARLLQVYAGESNGKQVAAEAGGRSPQLVLADADIESAASAVAWGIFHNAGQTCNAGSRVVVHASVKDRLLDAVRRITDETFRVGARSRSASTRSWPDGSSGCRARRRPC